MKVGIVGHYARNFDFFDGQTVKTRNLYNALVKIYGKDEVFLVDTYNYRKHPFKLIKNCLACARECENIILLPARNGIKVFIPFFAKLKKKYKFKLFYDVIGGWLPEFVESKQFLKNPLKKVDNIYVETTGMKNKLAKIGVFNVKVLYNFKDLKPINISEIEDKDYSKIKLCTFSRVVKEKGIENAINIVKIVNDKLKFPYCSLDIYGEIAEKYRKEFMTLIENSPNYINYKGVKKAEESVKTLKKYDFLLFPTYYDGEGLAGTIIDAFSSSVPVLASRWRYNGEIVKNKRNGFLFDVRDDEQAAKIIINIYNHKYDIYTMRKNCVNCAKNYTEQEVIRKLIKDFK